MNKQVSDKKFDQLMRSLLDDAAIDDAAINDIADSPAMWWGVQRRINEQKTAKTPWPPVLKRWLMIGVPTAAAVVIGLTLLLNRTPVTSNDVANDLRVQPTSTAATLPPTETVPPAALSQPIQATAKPLSHQPAAVKTIVIRHSPRKVEGATVAVNKSEIKTDFIALTYARDPDSGQIVRVRVPSSMMITLGLVASVKKPTDMVDAEVLVGDDGLTRAIRFIR